MQAREQSLVPLSALLTVPAKSANTLSWPASHVGKVPICLRTERSDELTWGFVLSVVRPATLHPLCHIAVYFG